MNQIGTSLTSNSFQSYFNPATKYVPSLWLLYFLNVPLIRLVLFLRLTPMQLTHLSNITFFISLYCYLTNRPVLFFVLQYLALGFDICDGVVARLRGMSSAMGSFYDHFSDQCKVSLLLVVISVSNDSFWIRLTANLELVCFLLLSVLNYSLQEKKHRLKTGSVSLSASNTIENKNRESLPFIRGKVRSLLKNFHSSIFVMYGNFMVPFFFMGFEILLLPMLFLVLCINLRSLLIMIRMVVKANSELTEAKIPWKGEIL